MDKATFLNILGANLKGVSYQERDSIISYYDELIEDYKEDGCSETEAVARLENPKDIACRAINESASPRETNLGIRILLILGLPLWGSILLAGALFVFSFLILIWCLPIMVVAMTVASVAVAVVGIGGAIPVMLVTFLHGLLQLGIGIFFLGVSYHAINLSRRVISYIKSVSKGVINSVCNSSKLGGLTSWLRIIGLK